MEGSRDHDSVRRSYDAVAEHYVASFGGELAGKPLDRALLACLLEQSGQDAPVADLGCGPGHVAGLAGQRRRGGGRHRSFSGHDRRRPPRAPGG
jgi:hypothetical protein